MECTQPLELTQTQTVDTDRICPEQIGFLGILGSKYPVKRGPNKIGRDPQTCNIVLNRNSISRQHAVINVLSGHNIMLMDLDSANKTRLNNRPLQAYIPVALCGGDTVQFGEVFGMFRLLQEETDLPCTQAVEVPDTPQAHTHSHSHTRPGLLRHAVVPESPDVSDKDDSFIVPSQPKPDKKFKSPGNKYIKCSSKIIAIQPIGSNKIDNIYWNSSKKSNSFNLDDSTSSLNESKQNGDELEKPSSTEENESSDSFYTADTQLPPEHRPSIYSQATQLPEYLPTINKPNQGEANKENDTSSFNTDQKVSLEEEKSLNEPLEDDIYNAHTQLPSLVRHKNNENIFDADTQLPFNEPAGSTDNMFQADTQLPPCYETHKSIHEMDTQLDSPLKDDSPNSLFTAETQLPPQNASSSINSQDTQLPNVASGIDIIDNIHGADTQLPPEKPNASNTGDNDLFNTEAKLPTDHKNNVSMNNNLITKVDLKDKFDKSDEVILFDEMETQSFLDDLNSQPILGGDIAQLQTDNEDIPLSQSDTITDDDFEIKLEDIKTDSIPAKRDVRSNSNESTDCEELEFLPTQKIPDKLVNINDDEDTDCEEDVAHVKHTHKPANQSSPKTSFEDLATQIIPENVAAPATVPNADFEDLATQVIPEVNAGNDEDKTSLIREKPTNKECFEDMLTQVIPEVNKEINFEDLPTQVIAKDCPIKAVAEDFSQYSDEVVASPFKIPFPTPVKNKRKDIAKSVGLKVSKDTLPFVKTKTVNDSGNGKYYNATQDILDDLCTQTDSTDKESMKNKQTILQEEEIVPSVNDLKFGRQFPHLDGEMEITVNKVRDKSSTSVKEEDKINKHVTILSAKQINEIIGVEVSQVKRMPSDPSDGEVTPKKVRPCKFLETLLPDSQEIKTNVTLTTKTDDTESSSESEQEKDSQEKTPIAFHKKKRAKANVKKDLTSKFDVQALPTRIITRTRKPTSKIQESDVTLQKRNRNILKPKFLNDTEQDEEMDKEIISENITRLKSKNGKKNQQDDSVQAEEETSKLKPIKEKKIIKTKDKIIDDTKNENQSVVVDLTALEDGDKTRLRRKNNKTKYNKEATVDLTKNEEIELKDTLKDANKNKPKESKNNRSKKKDVQGKITDYTISTDDSKIPISVSKVDDSLNTTEDTNSSTRSTRQSNKESSFEKSATKEQESSKRKRGRPKKEDKDKEKQKDSKDIKKRKKDDSSITQKEKTSKETKRRKRDDKQDVVEPEQEVRRSRRQKTTKEISENNSQSHRNHEQSTVYSLSSESSTESPSRKRQNTSEDAPSPKRTRSMTGTISLSSATSSTVTSNLSSNTSSLRSTPSRTATHYVLFTAFPSEEVKGRLEKLGAVVVTEVAACSVVLTLQLRRTFKLLCAVGLGKPIVGPQWVQACVDTGTIVDPWQHLLTDASNEARFKFFLARTLAGPRHYLRGHRVSATPRVLPCPQEMKLIVECSGGAWWPLEQEAAAAGGALESAGGRWVVVTCGGDRVLHGALRARGATLVSTEFILTGVLRQEADIDAYLIH